MPADRGASVVHTQDALLAENARLRLQLTEAEQRAARLTTQSASGGAFRDAEFMRSVLASSDDCIKVLDLDGNLTFMSQGGQRAMEVSDFNAIRGCPWPDFWHGELNVDARTAVETAKSGGTGRFQGMTETMAGTLKYWDVLVTPIRGPDGKPEKLLSVSRDITATRRVEEALGESEARFEAIADSIDQISGPPGQTGSTTTTTSAGTSTPACPRVRPTAKLGMACSTLMTRRPPGPLGGTASPLESPTASSIGFGTDPAATVGSWAGRSPCGTPRDRSRAGTAPALTSTKSWKHARS